MDQFHAQLGADPGQRRINKSTAVVDIDSLGDPVGLQGRAQRGREPDGVFGERPTGRGDQAGVVVHKREQVRFPAPDPRSVQPVADPDLVRAGRFEPPGRRGRGAGGDVQGAEVAQQRRFGRGVTEGFGHDPPDLGRGAVRALPLQRLRQRQGLGRRHRTGGPLTRFEPVEPVPVPGADPPVQGLPRVAHGPPVRAGVLGGGQGADHRPALAAGQGLVRGAADQLVTKQGGLFRPVLAGQRPALRFGSCHGSSLLVNIAGNDGPGRVSRGLAHPCRARARASGPTRVGPDRATASR